MSDRIFGLLVLVAALAFIASASQVQTSFLSDPVGPKAFPMLIGGVAAICALALILRPDDEPTWPRAAMLLRMGVALVVLLGYAYALKPAGFLLPTAIASALLSYQIRASAASAALTGLVLSVTLFVIFKYALGLSLFAFPKGWLGP